MGPEEASFRIRFIITTASQTPVSVNCSTVNFVQGIGYIDFGFIEPSTLVVLTDALRAGEKTPEELEARHLVRLVLSPEAMIQLIKQMNDVLSRTGHLKPAESK